MYGVFDDDQALWSGVLGKKLIPDKHSRLLFSLRKNLGPDQQHESSSAKTDEYKAAPPNLSFLILHTRTLSLPSQPALPTSTAKQQKKTDK